MFDMNKTTDFILQKAKDYLETKIFDVVINDEEKNINIVNEDTKNIIFAIQEDLEFFKKIQNSSFLDNQTKQQLKVLEKQLIDTHLNKLELTRGGGKIEVAVIGNFSSGKSMFINSILGDDVCPVDINPTTSSVTKFHFAPKETIKINNDEISKTQYHELVRHSKEKVAKNTNTYMIEYGYPEPLFSNIHLYDSPGFENPNNKNDEEETLKILQKVDVILYIIDIQKGSLGKKEKDRLQKIYKNKKIIAILNKADTKDEKSIKKIQTEIENSKLFEKVIPYSAKNVFTELKDNKINQIFEEIKENLKKEKEFEYSLKAKKEKGRRKTYFKVYINDAIIDKNYINSTLKRDEVLNYLNYIAIQKPKILSSSLKSKEKRIKTELKTILTDVLKNPSQNNNSNFKKEVDMVFDNLYSFERQNEKKIRASIRHAFYSSLDIREVPKIEKSYWRTPYYKIVVNKKYFYETIYLNKYFEEYKDKLYDLNLYLKEMYGFKLVLKDSDIKDLNPYYIFDVLGDYIENYKQRIEKKLYDNREKKYYDNRKAAIKAKADWRDFVNKINNKINPHLTSKLKEKNENAIANHDKYLSQNNNDEEIKQAIKDYLKIETII